MLTPYFPSLRTCATVALPHPSLPITLCQSPLSMIGKGNQARDTPLALRISIWVVASKVRQGASASAPRQGRVAAAAAVTEVFRKSRRFMWVSFRQEQDGVGPGRSRRLLG